MAIYESISFLAQERRPQKEGYYTYMEAAHELADYVKKMGYTHVELMGIADIHHDGPYGAIRLPATTRRLPVTALQKSSCTL